MGLLDEDPEENADAIRQREYRIRQHIRHSLIDFRIIARLYDGNLEKVFEDLHRDIDPKGGKPFPNRTDPYLADGIEGVFEFLYLGLGSTNSEASSSFRWLLEQGIQSALVRLYAYNGMSVEPDAWLNISPGEVVPIGEVREVYEDGEYVSRKEMEALFWAGVIDHETVAAYKEEDLPPLEELEAMYEKRDARREKTAVGEDVPMKKLKDDVAESLMNSITSTDE